MRYITAILLSLTTLTSLGFAWQPQRGEAQCVSCHEQGYGSIEGTVLDELGNPASGFTVYAESVNFMKGEIPTARTDRSGQFRLTVPVGTHKVYAGKESAGYPENMASVYGLEHQALTFVVTKEANIRGVVLRLGTRLGRLKGKVLNVTTKKAVTGGHIALRLPTKSTPFYEMTLDDGLFAAILGLENQQS